MSRAISSDQYITWVVIDTNGEYFSAHAHFEHAEHNAVLIGGTFHAVDELDEQLMERLGVEIET